MAAMIEVEIVDADGQVVATMSQAAPLVIGTAPSAGLRLQGEGVGAEHVRVDLDANGGFTLRQLDEDHSTYIGALQLSEAQVPSPACLRIGDLHVRLTRADEPSRPVASTESPRRARAWALFLLAIAFSGAVVYLTDYTDSPAEETSYLAIGLVIFVFLWAGAWALGNRVFRHPLAFARHLEITSIYLILGVALANVESALLAAVHVDGLETALNLTIWGVWWIAFMGSHVAVAGTWPPKRRAIVSGAIYYAILGLAMLVPSDSTPGDQVRTSLLNLGYLPAALYVTSDVEKLGEDAAALVEEVEELPATQDGG